MSAPSALVDPLVAPVPDPLCSPDLLSTEGIHEYLLRAHRLSNELRFKSRTYGSSEEASALEDAPLGLVALGYRKADAAPRARRALDALRASGGKIQSHRKRSSRRLSGEAPALPANRHPSPIVPGP